MELNPENLHKSVTDKCKLAKISRTQYYEIYKKPEFKPLVKNMALQLVASNVIPTIHAVARESKRGSAIHNKMILEMADLYAEKTKTELTGKNGGPIETVNHNFSYLSDDELDKELTKYG